MTPTTSRSQIGALATRIARTLVVTFLAVPGLGLGLLGVACQGDDGEPAAVSAALTGAADASTPEVQAAPEVAPPVVAEAPSWAQPAASPVELALAPLPEPSVAATPDAEPAPTAPEISEPRRHEVDRDADLVVLESALATGVSEREATGISARFDTGTDRVWAWVKVRNRQAPTTITMVWRHGDSVRSRVSLDVGTSSRWRTWSRRRVGNRDIGSWSVEVLDAEGHPLDLMTFEITGSRHSEVTASQHAEGGC